MLNRGEESTALMSLNLRSLYKKPTFSLRLQRSEVTHGDSLRVRFSDDAAALQMEVSDAPRHGKTPVDVGLADAVPGHKATVPLDPEHTHTVALRHSGDIYLSVGETLDVPPVLCNTKAEAVDINTISCMQECI